MSTGTALRPRIALIALGALLLTTVLVDRIFFGSSSHPPGTGSGIAATQARSLPRFTGVILAGNDNVVVHVGGRQAVVVHADSNLLGRVTTRVRAGTLVIGTTPGNLDARSPMSVVVEVPSLDAVRLQGAGNIAVTGIRSPRLTVALPGSGNIKVAGRATKLHVSIGGAGNAFLGELLARDARAALGGSGTIALTATRSLSAQVSGSGMILYGGNPPHVTRSVTGSGTIAAG